MLPDHLWNIYSTAAIIHKYKFALKTLQNGIISKGNPSSSLPISTASRSVRLLSLRKAEDKADMIHQGLMLGVDHDFHLALDFQTIQRARVMETRWLPQLWDQKAPCRVGVSAHNRMSEDRETLQLNEERGHSNEEWLLREVKAARKLATECGCKGRLAHVHGRQHLVMVCSRW